MSAGHLHLNWFDSAATIKKSHPFGWDFFMCLLDTIDAILLKAEGNRFASFLLSTRRKDICSLQFLNWWQQMSAGHLQLNWFDSAATIKISHPSGWDIFMVEPRGIEPLSESNLTRLSPSAVCYLHSLIPAGTNTLRDLVAS